MKRPAQRQFVSFELALPVAPAILEAADRGRMRTRRCYNCGAKLNRQLCFDFAGKTFRCDKCGALNHVYRINVDDDAQDTQGGIGYGGQIRKFKAYVAGLDEKMGAANARGVNVHYLSKRLDLAKDRLETLEHAYSADHHMDCGYELYAISIELSSVDKKIDEHEREKRRAEKAERKASRRAEKQGVKRAARPRKTPRAPRTASQGRGLSAMPPSSRTRPPSSPLSSS